MNPLLEYLEKSKYYILSFYLFILSFLLLLLLIAPYSLELEIFTVVVGQEDVGILVNEDTLGEIGDGDSTSNNEESTMTGIEEDKPFKLDTTFISPEIESQNFWNTIIILVVGIGVAVFSILFNKPYD